MDEATAITHIAAFNKELRKVREQQRKWERIARQAFEMHGGCLPLCRRACMCTCGYELYFAMTRDENKNG